MENNNSEILEAIHDLAQHVDEKFNDLSTKVDGLESEMATKTYVDKKIDELKTTMVTKDYLDEKLFDLRGDLVLITRKEDQKVDRVIHKLKEKNIFSDADATELLAVTPFPR